MSFGREVWLESRGRVCLEALLDCAAVLGLLHVSRLIFVFQDLHPDIAIDPTSPMSASIW